MDELDLARELADIADEISCRYFYKRSAEVSVKADGTLVTEADKEIEARLRKRISERFPNHAILGEEEGFQGDKSTPMWVIDPIDGTNNFAWGIPVFATLIGLMIGRHTEIGVASAPAMSERYEGSRGSGASFNGTPIHVSEIPTIEEARICYSSWDGWAQADLEKEWTSLIRKAKRSRGFGDFWGHMLVARGAAEVMAEPILAPWDVFPLEVIVEEAGGRITTFEGEKFQGLGSCLTTNGVLHDTVQAALKRQ